MIPADKDRLAYFNIAQEGYDRAVKSMKGAITKRFRIAGRPVAIEFAGPALVSKLTAAIGHLEVPGDATEPELTLNVWDCVSTGTPLPLLLSSLVELLRLRWFERLGIRKEIKGYHSERIRTIFHLGPDILSLYNTDTKRAVYWINSADDVPYYEEGYPLTPILNWWLEQNGLQLLHAASVGTNKGGVIICGKGGSGKSTTALSCINSRLKFLGDDYCALEINGEPRVWSLYSTSKLKGQEDIDRFPRFKRLISNSDRLEDEKALLYLNKHIPSSLINSFPLRAVFVPRITGLPETRVSEISPMATLRALAPSTMFQLPGDGASSFKKMSGLVKTVPCHHLDLGTAIERIPDAIAEYLDKQIMPERNFTVSVIVIAYNEGRFVKRALDCVYSQSRIPDEVIFIDDGSTDETSSIVEEYPNIRYFYHENQGPSAARNLGAKMAVGEVIAFLDVDDLWEEKKLEREVGILEKDATIGIAQGLIVDVNEGEEQSEGAEVRVRVLSSPYPFVNIGSLTIRRATFQRIGEFDEDRREDEDTDWFLRAWECDVRKELVDYIGLYYTIRNDSLSGSKLTNTNGLPSLLKQHRKRAEVPSNMRPKVGLQEFFVAFPDRRKRRWNGKFAIVRLKVRDLKRKTMGSLVPAEDRVAEKQFRLARVWKRRGRWKQAVESYRRVIDRCPAHAGAFRELGSALQAYGSLEEVIDFYKKAVAVLPNEAELHKAFINIVERAYGIERAMDFYRLKKVGIKKPEIVSNSLVCCFVCRNESKRLPFFLEYYRGKGVTHFLAVDNGSDDGSYEYLTEQSDVYLWRSDLSFNRANFGSVWFELILRENACGCWCLTVDVDELLYYPDCESISLTEYCDYLDRSGKRALSAVLLEMYSKNPVSEANYEPGESFLKTCPYFDPKFFHKKIESAGPFSNMTFYFGGARERIFGKSEAFCQTKVALIKYDEDCILAGGQHWTNLSPNHIAKSRGCLLHFKYFSDFRGRVNLEVQRGEHYQCAAQYRQYLDQVELKEDRLTLYHPDHSARLLNSQQLIDLGIIRRTSTEEESGKDVQALVIPKISSLVTKAVRPNWSVMITVYDRITLLPRCLESILRQAESPSNMHIEVVADKVSEEKTQEISEIVEAVGKGRIEFYPCVERMGHPHIFNLCIERARGEWVHLIHDDDWLAPGYYQAMGRGIESRPDIGAAFCRYALMGKDGVRKWISSLERKEPGVISNWVEQIGAYCRLAFSSMAVRRSVFEEIGGFSPSVGSAFDWDMWKRVSVDYPVWFEPQTLVYCGREGDSLTDGLMQSGEQIRDSLRSIELSDSYLPIDLKDRISESAREHYADWALSLAKRQLAAGAYQSAFNNINCGLRASRSKQVQEKLLRVLGGPKGK